MTNSDSALKSLGRLVGHWTTEATHPAFPGVTIHGTVDVEWLEGERFLIHRARSDHPDFPDSISVIGFTEQDRVDHASSSAHAGGPQEQMRMHYFDSRGVFRWYGVSIDDAAWRIWRDAPGFSQRFTGKVADGARTIVGKWQLQKDDDQWNDDLEITYRRKS